MYGKGTPYVKAYLQEILLYSGQYALFYLLMQAIIEGGAFFAAPNHLGVLLALLVQTGLLVRYGANPGPRAALTFLVPLAYGAMEMIEGAADLLNAAHVGFWAYALLSGLLLGIRARRGRAAAREVLMIAVNVLIFIYLYFYFDAWKELRAKDKLTIATIFGYVPAFLGDPTHWFIIFGGSFLSLTIALSRVEVERLRARIHALFGAYVDADIRDLIIRRGGGAASEARELGILFADIRGFTALCERHGPQEITGMLNAYFDEWNAVVKAHGGTVDKYIGDAIMVLFGLQGGGNACEAAARCAAAMRGRRDALFAGLRAGGLPVPEDFGIGLHFGEVIVGDIGSGDRRNFTVIGDAVNVAARLEAETRRFGAGLLISRAVFDRLEAGSKRDFRGIGDIELKGKERRISAYVHDPAGD